MRDRSESNPIQPLSIGKISPKSELQIINSKVIDFEGFQSPEVREKLVRINRFLDWVFTVYPKYIYIRREMGLSHKKLQLITLV
jgi:hypothetical protein